MSNSLLAFFGSLLAGLIVALIDAKFRHPAATFESAPIRAFPHLTLLRVSAFVVIAVWVAMLSVLVSMILAFSNVWPSKALFIGSIGAVVGLVLIDIPLAFSLRCPSCQHHLLVQWTTTPRFSDKDSGLNEWASIVLLVIMRKTFRCMYCGQTYAG